MADSMYQHKPLQSKRTIRIFNLSPAHDRKSPIQGSLLEVDLDSNPNFEALSYVWGRPDPRRTIAILTPSATGFKPSFSLEVTPNCLSALQTLRFRFRARRIWIDAICIDQTSTSEKNQQVPLMAEIYGKAKQVLVYLDPGNENRGQVQKTTQLVRRVGCLHRLRLLRLYDADEHTKTRMPKHTKLVATCENYVNSRSQKLGDSFNAPFMNAYFQRVWTVQEIAMAHAVRVHYGTCAVSWRDFVASALFTVKQSGGFSKNQEAEINVFQDMETQWKLLNSLESHFVLPDIYGVESLYDRFNKENILGKLTPGTAELALVKSKGLNATEPRDKAYAMLWAFPESSAVTDPLRRADYNKSIEEIYTEYTTAIFVRMRGAPIQFYWVNSTQRNTSLPSWVPDWKENTTMLFSLWAQDLRSYRAAKEDSGRYKIEIEGRLLRVWGVEHSKIHALIRLTEEVRQSNHSGAEPEVLLEALIDSAELLKSFIDVSKQIINASSEEILERLHRVLHSRRASDGPGPEDQSVFVGTEREVGLSGDLKVSIGLLRITLFDKLSSLLNDTTVPIEMIRSTLAAYLSGHEVHKVLERVQTLPNLPPFFAVAISLSPFVNIYHFVYRVLIDHRDKDFFLTDKGNIGIAFHGLAAGDTIALWKGCPSPMVARKVDAEGRGFYRFHGPAYVDGIMNGEAWITEEGRLQTFELI